MSFQILWISVKQYNEKQKSHRNGVKITTLPNNQYTPAPPQLTPTPQPQTLQVKGMSWYSITTREKK